MFTQLPSTLFLCCIGFAAAHILRSVEETEDCASCRSELINKTWDDSARMNDPEYLASLCSSGESCFASCHSVTVSMFDYMCQEQDKYLALITCTGSHENLAMKYTLCENGPDRGMSCETVQKEMECRLAEFANCPDSAIAFVTGMANIENEWRFPQCDVILAPGK